MSIEYLIHISIAACRVLVIGAGAIGTAVICRMFLDWGLQKGIDRRAHHLLVLRAEIDDLAQEHANLQKFTVELRGAAASKDGRSLYE
jgi:hypothetical protein